MQLVLYRGEARQPESISGLAVSNKYIGTAYASGVIEIFSNPHLFSLARIDIGMRDIQTMDFNGDVLIVGSLTEGIACIDTLTFAVKREKKEGVWKVLCHRGDRMVLYSLAEGGSEVFVNGEFVYRYNGYISAACFGHNKGEFILGTHDGRVIKIENGRGVMDIALSKNKESAETVMELVHIVGDEYGCCTIEGNFHVVDLQQGVIHQTVNVRNSSLNTMCTMGEKVYMAGADSRIICYMKTNKHYIKESQDDVCYSDALFMRESNGNIVLASESGVLIVVHLYKTEKRLTLQKYPAYPVACTNNKVYMASGEEMEIFKVEQPEVAGDSIRSKCIFKHIAKSPILDIKSVDTLSVIRTKEGVRAYEYDQESASVKVTLQIGGLVLYHTVIENQVWCVMEKKKRLILTLEDLNKSKGTETPCREWVLSELGIDFVPTHIAKGRKNGEVLISGSDIVIFNSITSECTRISSKETEYFISHICGDKVYGLGQNRKAGLKDSRVVSLFSTSGEKIGETGVVFKTQIIDMQICNNEVFIVSQKELIVLQGLEEKKIVDMSAVIDGASVSEENGVFAVQRPWQFAMQKIPLQVFKEKYGRR
ncbi:hypothetical protein NERG_01327 [Nematocida ausubeli]|uniref:Uncharacterized protein n=1 Tax=Nematocida ausubeli (strain ATCC PRA-371 / ERTm2) TaxID=1913371 RepID=H8ZC84_NEMA1|nr:hypothetical protein NERG_01327 [Nematocida ausubeli]